MKVDCTSKGVYDSLAWCSGQTTYPGIRPKVYYIPKSWIQKWPTLPAMGAEMQTMDKLGTYEGEFVLASEKKWMSIDTLSTKSNVQCDSQGEMPSKTFLNKGTLLYAGTDAAAAGFCRQANIDQLVFLVQQRDGQFRVLGSEAFDIECKPSQASGEGTTGQGGTTINVEATDVCPAPFFVGKIETADGNISGKDGSAVVEAP